MPYSIAWSQPQRTSRGGSTHITELTEPGCVSWPRSYVTRRTIPLMVNSYFLIAEADKNIPAAAHHFMAERANGTVVSIDGASHAVFASHPAEVADRSRAEPVRRLGRGPACLRRAGRRAVGRPGATGAPGRG